MTTRKGSTAGTGKKAGRSPSRLRYAVLVLGMHRSGTSALSGVLAKLGATPPRSLMAANEFNAKGYWESKELVILHDEILKSAGSRWSDWGRFNEGWFESPVFPEFEDRLEAAITREYGDCAFFSVKDPRMSRFLPIWLRTLDRMKIAPKVIVSVRHPEEVVRSLERRDRLGRGKGLLLWLRHVLEAEVASRHLDRAFIRYEDMLQDWRSQMRRVGHELGVVWPRWSFESEAEIADFLSSELRHHDSGAIAGSGGTKLDEWVRQVYTVVEGFAAGEPRSDASIALLDGVRNELDQASDIFGPIVREHELGAEKEYSTMKSRMGGELEEARQKIAAAGTAIAAMESRAVRAETDARSRAGRLMLADNDRSKLESRMLEQAERQQQREAEAQARLVVLQNESQAKVAALQEELKSRTERYGQQEAALAAQLAASQSGMAEREAGLSRLQDENRRLEASMAESAEQYRKTEAELMATLTLMKSERDQLSESLARRFQELAEFANRAEGQRKEHNEMVSRIKNLQQQHDALAGVQRELDDLRLEFEGAQTDRKQLSAKVSALNGQIAKGKAAREALQLQVESLSSELHAANGKMATILASNTWKIGRPFRVARRFLGRSGAKSQIAWDGNIARIRSSKAFDEQWYLARYPDVATLGMDPVHHYLAHGCREGRDPSPAFSTTGYYKAHPEINAGTHNALLHFLDHGG